MRLLSWNILHGGGRRMPEIVLALLGHDADVIALTEYRVSVGGQLRAALADHGYRHQLCTDPPPRTNGVLLLSRQPASRIDHPEPPPGLSRKYLAARIKTGKEGLNVLVVHIPEERRGPKKPESWRFLLDRARPLADEPTIVLGDFNTGRHRLDESGSTFRCTALLGELATMGYADAWRSLHPENKEFTWFSRTDGGFRIDHAYASRPLVQSVLAASYSHAERERGWSDHSALIVDLDTHI